MPAATHPVIHREREIPVVTDDSAVLLTDRWWADGADGETLLIRMPYGRENIAGVPRFIAEHGHCVVVQSCRGTLGADGTLYPLRDEVADGQAARR